MTTRTTTTNKDTKTYLMSLQFDYVVSATKAGTLPTVTPSAHDIVALVATTITRAGGIVTTIGVTEWHRNHVDVAVTYAASTDTDHDNIVSAIGALTLVKRDTVKDSPAPRERKFKGSTGSLVFACVLGGGVAICLQSAGGFNWAIFGALLVAMMAFILTIVDDFVGEKDVHSTRMDGFITPWLKTAIASYAAAAAIGIYADKSGTSRLEALGAGVWQFLGLLVAVLMALGIAHAWHFLATRRFGSSKPRGRSALDGASKTTQAQ